MKFTSLDEVLNGNYIKSIPHLTRLDLTANEIKLIELILSFTKRGNEFFMSYANIAEYLHLGDTKNKAKSVGNIVASVKLKGYIISETTHNFNGKNGGSSANLKVNEVFLERQLNAFFNPVATMVTDVQISPLQEAKTIEANTTTKAKIITAKSFIDELAELEKQDERVTYFDEMKPDFDKVKTFESDADVMGYQSIDTLPEFEAMLKRLMRKDSMTGKKSAIQYMIDNEKGWDIETMKEAFEGLVLTPIL